MPAEVSLTGLPSDAHNAVMVHSRPVDETVNPPVHGLCSVLEGDSVSVDDIVNNYPFCGLQASNLGKAAEIIRDMLSWRLSDDPLTDVEKEELDNKEWQPPFSWAQPDIRKKTRATIFLSFTSNMISSGLRDCFVYLAKHKLVDCFVTSAGGIEEDIIKCLGNFVIGSYDLIKGAELRSRGWNRIGNIYVPNENYIKFEDWLQPLLKQHANRTDLTPQRFIRILGQQINNESSLLYWCAKNDIPVLCPNFTDGALGDNIYFYNQAQPLEQQFKLDICPDIQLINNLARSAKKTGIIILGGGSPKHHICNANLMRNGADYAVYINTASEHDGSDSGAPIDEAVSWGKIKATAPSIKVSCDASIAFPLLVASVLKKEVQARQAAKESDFILRSPYHS